MLRAESTDNTFVPLAIIGWFMTSGSAFLLIVLILLTLTASFIALKNSVESLSEEEVQFYKNLKGDS